MQTVQVVLCSEFAGEQLLMVVFFSVTKTNARLGILYRNQIVVPLQNRVSA